MRGIKMARRCGNSKRAEVSTKRTDADIVADNLKRDYEQGCFWAGIAMIVVWGPLLLAHAWGCF